MFKHTYSNIVNELEFSGLEAASDLWFIHKASENPWKAVSF